MTTIYSVRFEADDMSEVMVPTLAEAEDLRERAPDGEGAITKYEVDTKHDLKGLLCDLFNHGNFAITATEVMPDKPLDEEGA